MTQPDAARSQLMARIRGKDTKPELAIRKALHRAGFRYRLHGRRLPGRPDIVFPARKAVIFIHGCFWHGHDCSLFYWPKSNKDFWKQKITKNISRDETHVSQLTLAGWRCLTVWECSLRGKYQIGFARVMARITKWLHSGSTTCIQENRQRALR